MKNICLERCSECGGKLDVADMNMDAFHSCSVCNYTQHPETPERVDALCDHMVNACYARGVDTCLIQEHEVNVKEAMRADALLPLFAEYGARFYKEGYIRNFKAIQDTNGLIKYRTVYAPDDTTKNIREDMTGFIEILDRFVEQTRSRRHDLSEKVVDINLLVDGLSSKKDEPEARPSEKEHYEESSNTLAQEQLGELIFESVLKGDISAVELLLKSGAPLKVNGYSATLVGVAVENRHYEILDMLLDAGASADDGWIKPHAKHHLSPLLLAAEMGDLRLIANLYSNGAFPGATCANTGHNAIELALLGVQSAEDPSGHMAVVEYLKEFGFKIDRGFAIAALHGGVSEKRDWFLSKVGRTLDEMGHLGEIVMNVDGNDQAQSALSGQLRTESRLKVIDSVVEEKAKEARVGQLVQLQKDGVEVCPAPDVSQFKTELDRDFPWLSHVTKILVEDLTIRAQGSGEFHLPPVILLGDPGVGKTAYCSRMAELSEVPFRLFGLAGSISNLILAGSERAWESAKPSLALQMMMDYQIANPLIMLDEIDKAGGGDRNGHPHNTLLGLLEPSSSKHWFDPFLMGHVDVSKVSWIATANSVAQMPNTLLSRFRVLRVEKPKVEHYPAIIWRTRRQYAQEYGLNECMLPLFGDAEWGWLEQYFTTPRAARKATEMLLRRMMAGGVGQSLH